MSARLAKRVTWTVWGVAFALLAAGVGLTVANRSTIDVNTGFLYAVMWLSAAAYSTVGGLIARRQRSNPIGWLFCFMAVAFAMIPLSQEYAIRGRFLVPGSLPAPNWFGFAQNWLFLSLFGPIALVFLLFPNGTPLSRRWRVVVWAAAASGALAPLIEFVAPDTSSGTGGNRLLLHGGLVPNPIRIGWLSPNGNAAGLALLVLFAACIAAAASVVLRLRRSKGVERQQVRWLAYTGAAAVLLIPVLPLGVALNNNTILGDLFWYGIISVLALGIPLASGVAVLKYRLYDLDVVVKKTVVIGVLGAFATLVYLAVVVGIGAAVGSRSNGALTLAAAAIVAIAFQPLRSRARRFADRVVYGERATPYEVLSEFSDRISASYSTDDVLPRMAEMVGRGTGAERATVWLRIGSEVRLAAAWPRLEDQEPAVAAASGEIEPLAGDGTTFPVRHRGELLGALGVTMRPAEPMTPTQERLIGDLAAQAGLILRNVRLIEELRASRQRLVAAQDAERRRLERNLHDGAQQQFVALRVQLGLAQRLAGKDAPEVAELLERLQAQAGEALDDLRDLARGIYPPLLADQGLTAALSAQASKAAVPVQVDVDGIGRYPQETEAAVYFCVLEALQNVAKYAGASRAQVRLRAVDRELAFEVVDDGKGFDPEGRPLGSGLQGMADRLDALGGGLEVRSAPGRGTTIAGRLPLPLSPAPAHAPADALSSP